VFELADNRNPASMASEMRRLRHAAFHSLLRETERPLKVLDVGGTEDYWSSVGLLHEDGVEITILNNLPPQRIVPRSAWILGDARDMSGIRDQEYDIVFSNSVLEHVGTLDDQKRAACEIRRSGKRYFVQTPNRFFPIEPHSLVPFYQFLPGEVRARLLASRRLGWLERAGSLSEARTTIAGIRLLDRRDLQLLFPEAIMVSERFLGLSKSLVACGGWSLKEVSAAFAVKTPIGIGFRVGVGGRRCRPTSM